MYRSSAFVAAVLLTCATQIGAQTATPRPRPTFDATGVVHVPAFDLPPSELASAEAKAQQQMRANMRPVPMMEPDIDKSRKALDQMLAPQVAQMLKKLPH